jgi:hypothetical protein
MDDRLQTLVAKDLILDTITRLFVGTDQRDWGAVRACLAPRVHFDMTSLAGSAPADRTAEEIIAGWEEGLRPIEAVHHQAGNYRVEIDGERARAFCYGIALHYRRTRSGRNTRTFVGSYDFGLRELDGAWRIDAFRFNLKYLDGNLDLERAE